MTPDKDTPLLPPFVSPLLPQSMRDLMLYKDVEQRIAILINLLPADKRDAVLCTAAVRAARGTL